MSLSCHVKHFRILSENQDPKKFEELKLLMYCITDIINQVFKKKTIDRGGLINVSAGDDVAAYFVGRGGRRRSAAFAKKLCVHLKLLFLQLLLL